MTFLDAKELHYVTEHVLSTLLQLVLNKIWFSMKCSISELFFV